MVRKAQLHDVSRIAEILVFAQRSAYRSIFCDDKESFNKMQVLPLALALQKPNALDTIYVYDDGVLKGMMKITIALDIVELEQLYVEPLLQQKGIGTTLLQSFFTISQNTHCHQAVLWVLEKNYTARKLYEKFGFIYSGKKKLVADTSEYEILYSAVLNAKQVYR